MRGKVPVGEVVHKSQLPRPLKCGRKHACLAMTFTQMYNKGRDGSVPLLSLRSMPDLLTKVRAWSEHNASPQEEVVKSKTETALQRWENATEELRDRVTPGLHNLQH